MQSNDIIEVVTPLGGGNSEVPLTVRRADDLLVTVCYGGA
jgi:hypothetical protein